MIKILYITSNLKLINTCYVTLQLPYICNAVYRFPEELSPDLTTAEREEAKTTWKSELDVKCGWGKTWEPDNVPGCVDPRGCT